MGTFTELAQDFYYAASPDGYEALYALRDLFEPGTDKERSITVKRCHTCLKELEIKIPVGRQETCLFCQADLHCCLNCTFYVMGSYNSCREPQAERVIEKGRSNFCGYFVFRDSVQDTKENEIRDIAKAKLEALFKID